MGRPKGSKNNATHCLRGHPRTPDNLYKSGACKLCYKVMAAERAPARRVNEKKRLDSSPEERKKRNEYHAQWKKENSEACRAAQNKRRTLATKAGGLFTAEEWFTLCFAVGFKCLCCGEKKPLEADHVIPVSKGGTSWLWNIQPLCKPCNVKKHGKTIDYRV